MSSTGGATPRQVLVIVTDPEVTGKSTVARRLAAALALPCCPATS